MADLKGDSYPYQEILHVYASLPCHHVQCFCEFMKLGIQKTMQTYDSCKYNPIDTGSYRIKKSEDYGVMCTGVIIQAAVCTGVIIQAAGVARGKMEDIIVDKPNATDA